MAADNSEFVYKIPGISYGKRPGAHRSRNNGAGMMFASHARLFDQPDPRRIDFRASMHDVRGEWLVRRHYQRSSIAIRVIVDVSASMHFGSQRSKLVVVSDFLEALGMSAYRAGDAVSLMAFDQAFREDLFIPAQYSRAMTRNLSQRVRECERRPQSVANVEAILSCVDQSPSVGGIIFLVSDYHWPLAQLESVLERLGGALVAPLVVWDPAETEAPQQGRFVSLYDAESGRFSRLWLRSKIRQQWRDNVQRRRAEIAAVFGRYDIRPFYLEGHFDAEKLSEYFLEQVA